MKILPIDLRLTVLCDILFNCNKQIVGSVSHDNYIRLYDARVLDDAYDDEKCRRDRQQCDGIGFLVRMAGRVDEEIVSLRKVGDIVRDIEQRHQGDAGGNSCFEKAVDHPISPKSVMRPCSTFPRACAGA